MSAPPGDPTHIDHQVQRNRASRRIARVVLAAFLTTIFASADRRVAGSDTDVSSHEERIGFIEGRITDASGKPVAKARVSILEMLPQPAPGSNPVPGTGCSTPIDASSGDRSKEDAEPNDQITRNDPLVTDDNGRFRFDQLLADRQFRLQVEGAGIATSTFLVQTTDLGFRSPIDPTFPVPGNSYGHRFEHRVVPSRTIVGIIIDAASKQAIADVTVRLESVDPFRRQVEQIVEAQTDAEGHFVLEGVARPKNQFDSITVAVLPGSDRPYFARSAEVPYHDGDHPAELNLALRPAQWIEGQITDSTTGESVQATIGYAPASSNEFARHYNCFQAGQSHSPHHRYNVRETDAEGRYRTLCIPGPGIITVVAADSQRYQRGVGTDSLDSALHNAGRPKVYGTIVPDQLNVVAGINPQPDEQQTVENLTVVPAKRATVELLDPDGKPLTGIIATNHRLHPLSHGRLPFGHHLPFARNQPQESHLVEVTGIASDDERSILFRHEERGLGRIISSRDIPETPDEPFVVELRPDATVTCQLVGVDGKPVRDSHIMVQGTDLSTFERKYKKTRGSSMAFFGTMTLGNGDTDADGRVKLSVTSGVACRIMMTGRDAPDSPLARELSLKPGDTVDLGMFNIHSDPADWPKPTFAAAVATVQSTEAAPDAAATVQADTSDDSQIADSEKVVFDGRVILPDGRPAAGATVRAIPVNTFNPLWTRKNALTPKTSTEITDSDGRFSIAFSKQPWGDLSDALHHYQDAWKDTQISATLDGFGGQWVNYRDVESAPAVTLRLVEDHPVRGRIVNRTGRPVEGVNVTIDGIGKAPREDLRQWLNDTKNGRQSISWNQVHSHGTEASVIGLPESVTSGPNGEFEIRGVGKDRCVNLIMWGDSCAIEPIAVFTRDMEPLPRSVFQNDLSTAEFYYGADFTIRAEPSRPVTGVIRDAQSGEPLPDVSVEAELSTLSKLGFRELKTTTDADGRYRLVGIPQQDEHQLVIVPGHTQPYFARRTTVTVGHSSSGQTGEINHDVELHRGVWLTGRVTNKVTQRPVLANVTYLPWKSNPHNQETPEFGPELDDYVFGVFHHTQSDGTYRLVALPGPGIVTVDQTTGSYLTGIGYDVLKCPRRGTDGTIEAIGPSISPNFGMPNAMREFDIPNGADSFEQDLQLDPGQTVELRVVDPEGRPLRNVSVATFRENSTEKHLYTETPIRLVSFGPGEVREVLIETAGLGVCTTIDSRTANSERVEIQLRPTATLKGQLFHEDGTPLAEARLATDLQPFNSLAKDRSDMKSDRNGRFEIPIHADVAVNVRVVVPGISGSVARQVILESGEVKDLGALQLADGRFQSAKSSEATRGHGDSLDDPTSGK